jgi:hypothetical protein
LIAVQGVKRYRRMARNSLNFATKFSDDTRARQVATTVDTAKVARRLASVGRLGLIESMTLSSVSDAP